MHSRGGDKEVLVHLMEPKQGAEVQQPGDVVLTSLRRLPFILLIAAYNAIPMEYKSGSVGWGWEGVVVMVGKGVWVMVMVGARGDGAWAHLTAVGVNEGLASIDVLAVVVDDNVKVAGGEGTGVGRVSPHHLNVAPWQSSVLSEGQLHHKGIPYTGEQIIASGCTWDHSRKDWGVILSNMRVARAREPCALVDSSLQGVLCLPLSSASPDHHH